MYFFLITVASGRLSCLIKLGQQKWDLNCTWFQEILKRLIMTQMDYKWLNSQSNSEPCALTSTSFILQPFSKEVVVPRLLHVLFSLFGIFPLAS